MPPFIRSPYNYDVKEASDASAVPSIGESLTVQSQAEDADINVLMKRFGVTGKFPENPLVPTYADFSNVGDFRSAWEACDRAAAAFMQYPADFRARFDNDPQLFLQFAENADNIPEMRKLGMFKESVNVDKSSGGNSPPSSGSSGSSGGARAAERNPGVGVSERPVESGAVVSGGKAGSAQAV